MPDWERNWNSLRIQFMRLQDEMTATDKVLTRRDAGSWDRAGALRSAADALCKFLSRCRDEGVFQEIAEDVSANVFKERLLAELETVLRQEEEVLQLAKFDPESAQLLMQDVKRIMEGKWRVEPMSAAALVGRAEAAISAACSFPGSDVLVLAKNFGDWVLEIDRKYHIAIAVVLAGANVVVATHMPEPFFATKVSKLIAGLLIGTSTGDGV